MATILHDKNAALAAANSSIRILPLPATVSSDFLHFHTDSSNVTFPSSITLKSSYGDLRPNATYTWKRFNSIGAATPISSGVNLNSLEVLASSFLGYYEDGEEYVEYQCDVTEPLYATVTSSHKIFYSKDSGSNALFLNLTNDSAVISADYLGENANYAATPTGIEVVQGNVALILNSNTYSATYPSTAGRYNISVSGTNGLTAGSLSGVGTTLASAAAASGMLAASTVGKLTFTIYARLLDGTTTSKSIDQSLSKTNSGTNPTAFWVSSNIASIRKDTLGILAPTSITFSAYKNIAGATSAASVYYRVYVDGSLVSSSGPSTSISFSSYTSSNITISCKIYSDAYITELDTEGVSIISDGAQGEPGLPGDTGSVGAQGTSARRAYYVSSVATVSGSDNVVSGDVLPSAYFGLSGGSWSATSSTPSAGQYLYQSDGLYNPVTNQTTWKLPYWSSLKVGSLSAIAASMGALTVDDSLTMGSSGSIKGGQTSYGIGTGFFLGYEGGYKFSIGSASKSLKWDGSNLVVDADGIQLSTPSGVGPFSSSAAKIIVNNGLPSFGVHITQAEPSESYTSVAISATLNSTQPVIFINNTGSGKALSASGIIWTNNQIQSILGTGTAPISVSSTTVCPNLNVSYLNGYSSGSFSLAGHTHSEYASTSHTHSEYASTSHTHSDKIGPIITDNGVAYPDSGVMTLSGNFATSLRFYASSGRVDLKDYFTSDARLKENIIPEELGLSFINSLLPVSFNYINNPQRKHGFIAQDVEKLIDHTNDNLKITNPDGIKGLDYEAIIAPLVKAVQELSKVITEVKSEIEVLKNGKL